MIIRIINKLNALRKFKHIFLLSHMRANTSLFGHILGSNPAINGYYEMHMGYYSWKSFIRQKMKYLEHHHFKPGSEYIFDKILHNEHFINCDLLNKTKSKIIISLRAPKLTIPSIISHFSRSDNNNEFSNFEYAAEYYDTRLTALEKYSVKFKNNFIFIDAESIKTNTKDAFTFLEQELCLNFPLSEDYQLQALTGTRKSGDGPETLGKGKIINQQADYSHVKVDDEVICKLTDKYNTIRKNILLNSKTHL